MQGYGSHTYQWINAEGGRFWVKYHFKSNQGVNSLTSDEAAELAGSGADFYIRDLQENIAAGNFPSWDLHVQVLPYEDARTYRFNPFDLTKVWPHSDCPLVKAGTLELNRNPVNLPKNQVNNYSQDGTLYREAYDGGAKARLLDIITGAVGGMKNAGIKERANLGAGQTESDAEAANRVG